MKLQELVSDIQNDIIDTQGEKNVIVKGIASDSRKVSEGFIFIATRGVQSDGHDFIGKAIELGAKVIVYETEPADLTPGITYIKVKDSADAVGKIASAWFGHPSQQLNLVGVTGTNGKTTTATLLYKMFLQLGFGAGLLSTVCNYVNETEYPATHTTPDPISLNEFLAKMVESGCEYAFMEVSSHAVHQKRISGLQFKGGIFTNLTQDHLDYHKTMQEYLKAKKMFFDNLPATAFALTNVDDKNGLVMLQNTKAEKHTYSVKSLADFKARILEKHFDGTAIEINGRELEVQFVGVFNVYNLLAVYGAAVLLGQDIDKVLVVLSTLRSVSGRFETIRSNDGFTAIVDYAHTPDALTNVLDAIHDVLDGGGRVISVVGCGGNRDKTKRPIMAQEAVRLSDQVILTSDNPRFEEPQAIIDDMVAGLDPVQMKKTLCIVEREQAIKTAYTLAKSGDVILIAGKGHEDYQDVKGIKHHFDDREIVRSILGL
ncbi:UDP-N-acetylmuramoyl-L-alanyl-D-glutamate--2,6-diaminopimelate ligase [Dysgonomonas macrotermitis]|uniref:UDP-N-acetylmuramoyl-L-alanyl-D-glutamate--2,6-diaminopimelate ligase n=1 Tax=Dysgonomonas macrotermitis TaxID=1346286 RepID=A0A1M4U7J5_9BACT|nr:UDP-N-acetylmuramoyl-L-alanyl-D-glutamate--2,6-diaminopimelate ligase [Dysgonomonas macrotermitis]SHE52742.1 UDP-N-acetylmuramoylalanyl-D-glutamate--2,6-diaminopimelate ligase [Dysgonomonas macrotermitis]